MKPAVLLACLLAGSVGAAEAPTKTTLYKSVGPDGNTVYSDRPPGEGRAAKTMQFESLPGSPLSAATLAYLEELRKSSAVAARPARPTGVVLFTTTWCGYCKKARAHLAAKGVAFQDVDIETQAGLVAYAQAGGQKGVPMLLANGQQVRGYSATAYDAVLAPRK